MLGAVDDGAALRGYWVCFLRRSFLILLVFVACAFALVGTVRVRRMGEILVLVREVVEQEGGRVVREGDGSH